MTARLRAEIARAGQLEFPLMLAHYEKVGQALAEFHTIDMPGL
jgi:hypothetical protein